MTEGGRDLRPVRFARSNARNPLTLSKWHRRNQSLSDRRATFQMQTPSSAPNLPVARRKKKVESRPQENGESAERKGRFLLLSTFSILLLYLPSANGGDRI